MIEGKVSRKNRSNNPFLTMKSVFLIGSRYSQGRKWIMNIRFEEDAENFVHQNVEI